MVYYAFCTSLAPGLEDFESVFDHVCALISLVANVAEFLFFLVIISELVRHNRGAASLNVGKNRRVHKNVVTGAGHFISWLIEFLLFFIGNLVNSSTRLRAHHFLFRSVHPPCQKETAATATDPKR